MRFATALAALCVGLLSVPAFAQYGASTNTSGGPLKPEQAAYDVTAYNLDLAIDPSTQSINGALTLFAKAIQPVDRISLDLDQALTVDRVVIPACQRFGAGLSNIACADRLDIQLEFEHENGGLVVDLNRRTSVGDEVSFLVEYSGQPVEAPRPPWDGGITWAETSEGQPWIAVSCQGEGADLWWPVKDHPSDEPDSMRISLTVPRGLRAISNGRHESRTDNGDGTATETWFVSTPINNYGVSYGVGPYEEVTATYESPYNYTMPVIFYVLPEKRAEARRQLPGFLDAINFLERTYGPYGFRADGYKVLHTPYLGMEHQSLIAYGSTFEDNEYGFDWLHFHELAHEWWANLGTARDWNDFWIHESFANYSEALYAEDIARRNGEDPEAAYLAYIATVRPNITNVLPVAPRESRSTKDMYTLPDGSFNGDIYFKGSWFLHTLRFLMDDDTAFFRALRRIMYPDPVLESATDGSANHFITTDDVQAAFEEESGRDLSVFFKVYLRQPTLPRLEGTAEEAQLNFRWVLPDGLLAEGETFDLPFEVAWGNARRRINMRGGEGSISGPRPSIEIDPDHRILIAADSVSTF